MLTDVEMGNTTFINYNTSDGLAGDDFMPLAGLRSSDGTFYFGSDRGLNTFRRISGSDVPPDVVLSNFLISNRSVFAMGEERPFSSSIEGLEKLVLNHDQNDLSFEFTALHYANTAKNQYAHKLEGVDDEWVYDNRNFVSYTNLPPGEYVLRLRASNAYGVWTEEGLSIPITITPPWWGTWWAYTAYTLLFLLLAFAFDRSMRRRIALREEKKNRERELAQAKEIEKAYHKLEVAHEDLKSAQQQLVQQEKLASLGQLTAGIAHEIKNPLNFVNNFSEVSQELIEEAIEELSAVQTQCASTPGLPTASPSIESLSDIKVILISVQSNLSKILQHGTRADAIVKSMLQHSRGGSGKMEPTDLNALLQEFVNLAFHGMRASKNPISVDLDFELDAALGDVNLIGEDMSRVVLNLANNAFDAMREKSKTDSTYHPVLKVQSKRNGDKVIFSITDNGPGIPESIKDKILQPFFTTKKGTDGTGLGLSITHDIIKAHGGELHIVSSQTAGTEFQIKLN
jgi:signal transduction histidine kinase